MSMKAFDMEINLWEIFGKELKEKRDEN